MEPGPDVDILMIGHFAKDQVVIDGRSETVSGGGVYYGSVALRRIGVSAAVVTRLHAADFPRLEVLKEEGIQVFATPAPETSGIENRYTPPIWNGVSASRWGLPAPFRRPNCPTSAPRSRQLCLLSPGKSTWTC